MRILQRFLLSILVFATALPAAAAPQKGAPHWCATDPARLLIAQARHASFQRYLDRERRAGRLPAKSAPTLTQRGHLAILDDDGTVTRPPNTFDLSGRNLQFLRRRQGMSVVNSPVGFKSLIGERLDLGDDDSVMVAFPDGFEFPFGNGRYRRVWVNSNGHLTFGGPSFFPVVFPPFVFALIFDWPSIAPLLTDLDPSAADQENGVFVSFPTDRVRITWKGVPEFGTESSSTFQVTLFRNGRVNVSYGEVGALDPAVGISPFGGQVSLTLIDIDEELPVPPRRAIVAEQFTAAPEIDEIGAVRLFAESFADIYTSVFLWLDFPAVTPGFAFTSILQNDVEGIGMDVFNVTRQVIPASRDLESYVMMGDMSRFPDDPDEIFLGTASTMTVVGHELGHRWLARVSFLDAAGVPSFDLVNGGAHWGYHTSSEGSLMHGNAWADNGDGSFSATRDAHTRFSPLDRYLMGLTSPTSVPDVFYIAHPDDGVSSFELPTFEATVNGERTDVSVDDIIAAEGPRRPRPALSPKSFRTAFMVVGLVGQGVSSEAVAKAEGFRQRWITYFNEATGGHGEVRTALVPRGP